MSIEHYGRLEVPYDDAGRWDGLLVRYYPAPFEDKIYQLCTYVADIRHGEYKDFHTNGQLWEHMWFKNGIRHGEYYKYLFNGDVNKATLYYAGVDLNIDPRGLSEKDKLYVMMSGRLPPRD